METKKIDRQSLCLDLELFRYDVHKKKKIRNSKFLFIVNKKFKKKSKKSFAQFPLSNDVTFVRPLMT